MRMNELEKSRVEIDEIDREMARLFERRMNVCADIAKYKKEHALPIFDPAREQRYSPVTHPLLKTLCIENTIWNSLTT